MSSATTFNSALETGVRAATILHALYPRKADLQRLVGFDYLSVHSADADGPPSLHPPLPFRSGELLVRRELIERGLQLMRSRGVVEQLADSTGFSYRAGEAASVFIRSLSATYNKQLRDRALWVASEFADLSANDLATLLRSIYKVWTVEFYAPTDTVSRQQGDA